MNTTTTPAVEKIYLRRQGISTELNTNNYQTRPADKRPPFSIRIAPTRNGHSLEITGKYFIGDKGGYIDFGTDKGNDNTMTIADCKRLAELAVKKLLNMDITISEKDEAYGPGPNVYPYQNTDIHLATAVYEPYTDTIRMLPENYCLIAWNADKTPNFDVDNAVKEGTKLITRFAHEEYLKEHNQRSSDEANKIWLAWFVSEMLKDTGKTPTVVKSFVQRRTS
jgi:hypothetical protein